MSGFRVRWSVDVDARTPQEAARKARALQLGGHISQIGYFRVYESPPAGAQENPASLVEVDLGEDWEVGDYQDPTD